MLYSNSEYGEIFDKVTMGVVHYIKKKPAVHDVLFGHYNGINNDLIDSWEEDNCCKLPEDLKNFYKTLNGLLIEWNIELNEEKHPVGRIEINSLKFLVLISTEDISLSTNAIHLKDLDTDYQEGDNGHRKPSFTDKFFELSSDEAYGKVCLVYKCSSSDDPSQKLKNCSIYFLDYSLQWHFLASTFLQYYRMLISHIGIPGWQFLFTDVDLSPETLLWFSMYLPYRLPSTHIKEKTDSQKESDKNKIDFTTLFKSKASDKKKTDVNKQNKNQTTGRQKNTKSVPARNKSYNR